MVPEIVTQVAPLRRWMAIWVPSWAGVTRPANRTTAPRAVRRTRFVPTETFGATPTDTMGLPTCGWLGSSTRYWVFSGTDSTGNENVPSPLVRWTSDAFWKPCVYGNGLLCRTIWRPPLPVPDSVPTISVRPPGPTGFGVAASERPSGWRWVLNVR